MLIAPSGVVDLTYTEPYTSNHVIYHPSGSIVSTLFAQALKIKHRGANIFDVNLVVQDNILLDMTGHVFHDSEINTELEIECRIDGVDSLVAVPVYRFQNAR